MKKSFFKNKIFCILTILSLIMLDTTDAFSQVPPVSGAQCVSCKMMNGAHATTCPYYNKGTQQKQPSLPSSNQSQEQKMLFDLLFQINNEIDAWVEKEEAIQASINETRKQAKQKTQDSLAKINHDNTKQQLKGLPESNSIKSSKTGIDMGVVTKCIGNNIEIYQNGSWKKINCSELNHQIIKSGDTLRTGIESKIVLFTKDEGYVTMFPNSKYTFPNSEHFSLDVLEGKIRVFFFKTHKKFTVRTGGGACCAVRGTKVDIISNKDNSAEILLFEGEVEILNSTSNERILKLIPGKKVKINSDGTIDSLTNIDEETLKKLLQETKEL